MLPAGQSASNHGSDAILVLSLVPVFCWQPVESKSTDNMAVPVRRPKRHGREHSFFHPFESLRKEMEELFDNRFPSADLAPLGMEGWNVGHALARLDVRETDGAIEVCVDLPGMDKDDVDVVLSDGVLTVKGERAEKSEDKEKDYHRVERSYGSFVRRVALPFDVDEDKIEARFDKGVLTVSLPKSEDAKSNERKIDVKAAKTPGQPGFAQIRGPTTCVQSRIGIVHGQGKAHRIVLDFSSLRMGS